ncbi:hypothetical protein HanIR_Chr05g0240011 [Helianthus annuus]|nr:hypothetical protein HanIR_Chr05g0240011 [Helianthus annuus]
MWNRFSVLKTEGRFLHLGDCICKDEPSGTVNCIGREDLFDKAICLLFGP